MCTMKHLKTLTPRWSVDFGLMGSPEKGVDSMNDEVREQ